MLEAVPDRVRTYHYYNSCMGIIHTNRTCSSDQLFFHRIATAVNSWCNCCRQFTYMESISFTDCPHLSFGGIVYSLCETIHLSCYIMSPYFLHRLRIQKMLFSRVKWFVWMLVLLTLRSKLSRQNVLLMLMWMYPHTTQKMLACPQRSNQLYNTYEK